MGRLVAFSHSGGVRVADVAFLFLVIAGIWMAFGWAMPERFDRPFAGRRFRMIVAGVLLAAAGVLLIVAAHWGRLFA